MNYIITDIKDRIATITINRPDQLNALSKDVLNELESAFNSVENNEQVGVIIFTGSGDKAFIAGADIKQMSQFTVEEATKYALNGQRLASYIQKFPKPVIAAINGYALGGGCEYAMACHIRYASENAMFGQPEVGIGLIAGFGGTQRLPRLVGKGIALELLLSGKMISSEEAYRIGLVNAVFPQDKLYEGCLKLAQSILKNAPICIKETIASVNEGLELKLDAGLYQEANRFGEIFKSEDLVEGLDAFVNKRKPVYKGK